MLSRAALKRALKGGKSWKRLDKFGVNFLSSIGQIYDGRLTISRSPTPTGGYEDFFFPYKDKNAKESCHLQAVQIKENEREEIKRYSVDQFYRIGNIPVALGLADTYGKHPILDQELGED